MEKQYVSIDLSTYAELINAREKLKFVKKILFNEENRLSYDKKNITFSIDSPCVKLIFPEEYETRLKELLRGEE